MRLEISTVMLQWAAGGLAFLWVTTRRREVGLGYGWLLRGVYAALAGIGLAASIAGGGSGTAVTIFRVASAATALAALGTFAVSVVRRRAGVAGLRERKDAGRERVAAMIGSHPEPEPEAAAAPVREFPAALDLVAPLCGLVGIFAAASIDGGPYALTLFRLLAGAALLGASTDAMLLGHWYLVQPGLGRDPIRELVWLLAIVWLLDVIAFVIPTGVFSVFSGSIDDGYGGLLAWIWLTSAVTTIALAGVTWLALKERSYSAVMAATGLLYLAILTAFGTDLVARALLAS
jgi:hypothetical protein